MARCTCTVWSPPFRDGDRRVLLQDQELSTENEAGLETVDEATFVVESPSRTGYSISPVTETNS